MITRPRLAASHAEGREFTQMTELKKSGSLVIVSNSKAWNREPFFEWLLTQLPLANPPIPHLGRLAELAGMHPSTLSNWRLGKNPPTTAKLSALADVLRKPRQELWARAGLTSLDHDIEVLAAFVSQAKASAEDWGVAMILASDLSEAAKKRLLEVHEEDLRRARAEQERQLREKIELLSEQ